MVFSCKREVFLSINKICRRDKTLDYGIFVIGIYLFPSITSVHICYCSGNKNISLNSCISNIDGQTRYNNFQVDIILVVAEIISNCERKTDEVTS